VNVWCGVLGNKLIGPFVFDNNLTGNTYEVSSNEPALANFLLRLF